MSYTSVYRCFKKISIIYYLFPGNNKKFTYLLVILEEVEKSQNLVYIMQYNCEYKYW